MASTRAFNVLEQRNTNENPRIGKTPLLGKNASRGPFKSALKDLTNSSSSRANLNSKQLSDGATAIKKPLLQKSVIASSVSRKKSTESNAQKPAVATKNFAAAPFPIFTPLDAEYSWGKEACLRDDLLEQMIDFHGVSYRREIKPMKPLRMDPLELPELELPRPLAKKVIPARQVKPIPDELPRSFLFGLPEVEIPDLDFMF
ncbi:uncharacterized protein LOC135706650 [Ochlerotatus camptorhynchus]|uniref:uncharacterized protein LOC135706650 n=1 Tax=Ochlerotatus camptorhynchus TaxID=644619 RepID=UPI0031D5A8F0